MHRFSHRRLVAAWIFCAAAVAGCFAFAASASPCPGVTLPQALLTIGRRANVTLTFDAARIARICVQLPAERDPVRSLEALAAQTGLRLVRVRPTLFVLENRGAASAARSHGERTALLPSESGDPLATIVVTGRRPDEEDAGLRSRVAAQSIDFVDRAAIDRLPVTTAADALRLVPGMQFDNQRGLGVYLFARGLDPGFQIVTLDGRSLAYNDLIENGTPRGRSFRFEMIPTELIDSVEVAKTTAAGDIDSAIGVTADIHTPRPFDLGRTISLEAKSAYGTTRDKLGGTLSALASWRNPARTFGLLVAASTQSLALRNDRYFEFEWQRDRFADSLPAGTYTPGRVRPTIEREDRRQRSLFVAGQWQIAPGRQLEATLLRTRLDVHYDELGLDIYPDDTTYQTPHYVAGSARIVQNSAVAGEIDNVRWMASRETSLNRHDLRVIGARYKDVTGAWTITADLGESYAHSYHPEGQGTSRSRIAFFAPLLYDFSRGYTVAGALRTTREVADPASYSGWIYNYAPKDSRDRDSTARLDLARDGAGFVRAIRTGLSWQRRSRDYRRRDLFLSDLLGVPVTTLGDGIYETLPVSDAFAGVAGDLPRSWIVPTATGIRDRLLTAQRLAAPLTADDLVASYRVRETMLAGYVAADASDMLGRLPVSTTLGLRLTTTEQRSLGYASDGMVATPVAYRRRYVLALPSFAVRAELAPDLVLRLTVARSLTRPNLTDIAPRFTTSLDNRTASGGNPQLRSFTGTNVDLTLAWYGGSHASASATLFQRRLDNYLTARNVPITVAGYGQLLLSTVANGRHAVISGGELVLSREIVMPPAIGGALALDTSLTLAGVRSRFNAGDREIRDQLVGLSRMSLTARMRYRRDRWSADLGYFWRSRYLNSYGTSVIGEEYVAPLGTLDGQIAFAASHRLRLALSATNLTDARKYLYGINPSQPKEINLFGRRLMVSARWSLHGR